MNYANENGSSSHSGARDSDYRDARGRVPDGTASSTPAVSAPDVPDEEFYWNNSMTGMKRQSGIRSFQSEFSNSNKFALICQLRSQPRRNQLYYRMFTWRSFACANDISSRNEQRGS
jgi:hypothetical protein